MTPPDDGRPAVFLDRDGVLSSPVWDPADGRPESPLNAADVTLVSGAAAGCRLLVDEGFALAIVSNQPAAAKGKATPAELQQIHERVLDLLAAEGVHIRMSRYCLHHPDAVIAALRERCDCRKPRPALLVDLAREENLDLTTSWMIGDADSDVAAGRAAGVRTVLVSHPLTPHRRPGSSRPDVTARDLLGAAAFIRAAPRVRFGRCSTL
ncbi:MAG: D-glycero-alpha-D-manno-heptose-1,7-bisphosphate 7-phosphatase [Solirubrobacteraceae bacterium]